MTANRPGKFICRSVFLVLMLAICFIQFSCVKNLNSPKLDNGSLYKIKFTRGDKFKITNKLRRNSVEEVCGDKTIVTLQSEDTCQFEVVKVEKDGSGLIKITIINKIMTMKNDKEKESVTFDARNPAKSDNLNDWGMLDIYTALVDEHFLIKVSPKGKVLEVRGVKERNERVLEEVKAKNAKDKNFESKLHYLKLLFEKGQVFSKETETTVMENFWRYLPQGQISNSNQWTNSLTEPSGDYRYEEKVELLNKSPKTSTYKVLSDFDSETARIDKTKKSPDASNLNVHNVTTYEIQNKTNWPISIKTTQQTVNRWKPDYCNTPDDPMNSLTNNSESTITLEKLN